MLFEYPSSFAILIMAFAYDEIGINNLFTFFDSDKHSELVTVLPLIERPIFADDFNIIPQTASRVYYVKIHLFLITDR